MGFEPIGRENPDPQQAQTERLAALAPPGLDTVLQVNSGSEAVDLALRILRDPLTATVHHVAGDALPRNHTGTVLALADKLETLVGLFGIGQLPTGDKDPFALRRHALGVLRMLVEKRLPLAADVVAPFINSYL